MRFLPFKGANTCDLRDPDLLFLGPHQPRPSCGRQRLPAHFSPQPIAEADCSGQHAIRKRPKPRAASPSAGPGSRGAGGPGGRRQQRPGAAAAQSAAERPPRTARPEPAAPASGAQNLRKASAARPDASTEQMLHSPNSFLIHDISLGTVGTYKQPLSKPKQPTQTQMERRRPPGPEPGLLRSRGAGIWKSTFQRGPAIPPVRVTPAPPFPGANTGHQGICHKDRAGVNVVSIRTL